jgi:hypothetical protein
MVAWPIASVRYLALRAAVRVIAPTTTGFKLVTQARRFPVVTFSKGAHAQGAPYRSHRVPEKVCRDRVGGYAYIPAPARSCTVPIAAAEGVGGSSLLYRELGVLSVRATALLASAGRSGRSAGSCDEGGRAALMAGWPWPSPLLAPISKTSWAAATRGGPHRYPRSDRHCHRGAGLIS